MNLCLVSSESNVSHNHPLLVIVIGPSGVQFRELVIARVISKSDERGTQAVLKLLPELYDTRSNY